MEEKEKPFNVEHQFSQKTIITILGWHKNFDNDDNNNNNNK